jgi:hypothetical protein
VKEEGDGGQAEEGKEATVSETREEEGEAKRTHHHRQQRAKRMEERPIDVVRDSAANRVAERKQQHLGDDPERRSKDDIANRPAVVEGPDHEDELGDDVDDDAGEVEDELENKETGGGGGGEAGAVLEGADGDEADNDTDDGGRALEKLQQNTSVTDGKAQRGRAANPKRQRCSVLDNLETDEAVYEQAPVRRACQPSVDGSEPLRRRQKRVSTLSRARKDAKTDLVDGRARRDDTRVEEDGDELDEEVQVEKDEDFLSSDGGVLGPDVQDHDDDHEEGADVKEGGSCPCKRVSRAMTEKGRHKRTRLEDESAAKLDVTGVTCWLYSPVCCAE